MWQALSNLALGILLMPSPYASDTSALPVGHSQAADKHSYEYMVGEELCKYWPLCYHLID